MKQITKTRLKKQLEKMAKDEISELVVHLYENSDQARILLSEWFLGEEFQDALYDEYVEKIEKVFNPTVRKLMNSGVEVNDALSLLKEYCSLVSTGNPERDEYLKNAMKLRFVKEDVSFLETYDGPEKMYNRAYDVFESVCYKLIPGIEGSREEAVKFYETFAESVNDMLTHEVPDSYGLSFDMQKLWDDVEKSAASKKEAD